VIASNGELGFGYGWNPFEFLSFWDYPSGDCSYYDDLPASQFAATSPCYYVLANPCGGQSPPSSNNGFTKLFLPLNANICFDNQNYLYAPPTFDINQIEAAGKVGGWSPWAMNAAVGQYGTFDFQRTRDSAGNTTFYTGYTPVSNFSVGAYLYSAGFSESVASFISNTYALFKSSNAADTAQATYRNLGYDTAARGQVPVCQSR
jgi:hypothetical protein